MKRQGGLMHRLVIGLAAFAMAFGAVGVQAETKITVSYGPGYPWIPAFVAKDQGIFAKHGLDVNLQFIAIGSNQPAALIAGTSQVAGVNPTIVIFADEGGSDIQIVAGANRQSKNASSGGALVRTGLEIKTPADFRGKKVAVPGLQSVIHVAFMKWLKTKGVNPADVTFIEVPINQMNDALRNGQVDAALPAAPFTDQILKSQTAYQAADYMSDLADPFTVYSVWAMRREYIAAHPAVAPAFRRSIAEAIDWIGKNEEAARRTQITYFKLPEQVALTVKLGEFTAEATAAQMQWWIDTCKELGLTKGTITVADILAK
jgi:NitT/TauT family transport system substrate-binding protein